MLNVVLLSFALCTGVDICQIEFPVLEFKLEVA